MSDFRIEAQGDGSYDLAFAADGHDFDLIGDDEDTRRLEIEQRVVYEFGTWLGESRFDPNDGFPWEQGVFGKQPAEGITALIYDRAASIEGVEGVEPPVLEVDTQTRKGSIALEIDGEDFSGADVQLILQGAQ